MNTYHSFVIFKIFLEVADGCTLPVEYRYFMIILTEVHISQLKGISFQYIYMHMKSELLAFSFDHSKDFTLIKNICPTI